MPPRSIALVIGQLQLGGAERQLCQLAVHMDKSSFSPVVICLSDVSEPLGSVLKDHQIPVEVIPRSGSYDLRRVRRLARVFKEHGVALAHSFLIAANAYTYLSSRFAGLPYIASSRTCIPARGGLSRRIQARAFRKASAIIANAARVVEFTCQAYDLKPDRFTVIPNGVAIDDYGQVDPGRREEIRAELEVPDNAILVGTLGRVSPEKNLGDFVAMAERLPGSIGEQPVVSVVIGDGPARIDLMRLAAEKGLGKRILFAGARSDVADVLGAFDIFVSTSSTEGLPNAVMEAMAAGLPVVATDVGGTAEVVDSSTTGFLVNPGDVDRLSRHVTDLLKNAPLRHDLGGAGQKRIKREFSVNSMTLNTVALYEKVLR